MPYLFPESSKLGIEIRAGNPNFVRRRWTELNRLRCVFQTHDSPFVITASHYYQQKIDAILELAKGLDTGECIALADHFDQLAFEKLAQRLESRPDICKD